MLKKYQLLILFLIIIIAAFFRLYKIADVPAGLYPDEATNGNNALEAIHIAPPVGGFKVFYPDNNGREGLFMNLQAISLLIFQKNEPWVLRLVSALFGIFTVLGLYFLTKELFAKTKNAEENSSSSFVDSGLARNLTCHLNNNIANNKNLSSIAGDNSKAKPAKGFAPLESQMTSRDPHFAAGFANISISNRYIIDKPEITALLSSFFLAISFWHINFSRIGFRAIMAPFFLVWGVYFLIRALNQILSINNNIGTEKIKNQKSKILYSKFYILNSILGGLFYGLGFYSYIAYRATPILIFIILLFYWLKNKEWIIRKKLLLSTFYFLLSTVIVALPLGLYFLKNPADFMGRTGQISVFADKNPILSLFKNTVLTLGMFNIRGDCNWRHNYNCAPQLNFIIGILFLIGLGYSVYQIFKPKNYKEKSNAVFGFWFLVFGFLLTLLPAILSNEGIPHALRTIIAIPFVYILAGSGAYLSITYLINVFGKMDLIEINDILRLPLESKPKPITPSQTKIFIIFIVGILAVLFILESYHIYFINWAKNKNTFNAFSAGYVKIGRYINSLPLEIPKYVVLNAPGVPFQERYTGRLLPMPAQTVMFITNSFLPEERAKKNIYYVLPEELKNLQIEKQAIVVYLEPNN